MFFFLFFRINRYRDKTLYKLFRFFFFPMVFITEKKFHLQFTITSYSLWFLKGNPTYYFTFFFSLFRETYIVKLFPCSQACTSILLFSSPFRASIPFLLSFLLLSFWLFVLFSRVRSFARFLTPSRLFQITFAALLRLVRNI